MDQEQMVLRKQWLNPRIKTKVCLDLISSICEYISSIEQTLDIPCQKSLYRNRAIGLNSSEAQLISGFANSN
jgi:hypothetical protein